MSGDPVWQVTLRSSVMDSDKEPYTTFSRLIFVCGLKILEKLIKILDSYRLLEYYFIR